MSSKFTTVVKYKKENSYDISTNEIWGEMHIYIYNLIRVRKENLKKRKKYKIFYIMVKI